LINENCSVMFEWYQNLPFLIDPVVFSIGFFSVRWYSLTYLGGFAVVYLLLRYRVKKGEAGKIRNSKSETNPNFQDTNSKPAISKKILNSKFEVRNLYDEKILDFMLYAVVGLLVGARFGYVFFYNFDYFTRYPWEIMLPFKTGGTEFQFTGIAGMSYHGGLIGIIAATWLFARKNRINFWHWIDFAVPAIPAGYFFGRLGNFLNGELYGRVTGSIWGMYFPLDALGKLRHPSQIYEAFFEGFVLFAVLWFLRNRKMIPASNFIIYIFGYGFFRFFIEFFREPDPQIGLIFNFLTLGQIFSLAMMAIAAFIYAYAQKMAYPNLFGIRAKKVYNKREIS